MRINIFKTSLLFTSETHRDQGGGTRFCIKRSGFELQPLCDSSEDLRSTPSAHLVSVSESRGSGSKLQAVCCSLHHVKPCPAQQRPEPCCPVVTLPAAAQESVMGPTPAVLRKDEMRKPSSSSRWVTQGTQRGRAKRNRDSWVLALILCVT